MLVLQEKKKNPLQSHVFFSFTIAVADERLQVKVHGASQLAPLAQWEKKKGEEEGKTSGTIVD